MSSDLQKIVDTHPVAVDVETGAVQPFGSVEAVPVATVPASMGRPLPARPHGSFELSRFVHAAFRGRYPLVIVLCLLAGAGSAALAWRLGRPLYQSEVLVRVRFHVPSLSDSRHDGSTPFSIVLASQKALIMSKRTTELALQSPMWQGSPPPERDAYFSKNLSVDMKAGSEFLRIIVTDANATRAMQAVNSVAHAYEQLYRSEEEKAERARLGVLQSRQSGLRAKIDELERKLAQPAADYGTTRLGGFYASAASEVTKLQSTLTDIDLEIAIATAASKRAERENGSAGPRSSTQPAGAAASRPAQLTPDQIAMVDLQMRRYQEDQERIQWRMEELKTTKGYGEAHPDVRAAVAALAKANERISRYADAYNSMPREFAATTPTRLGGLAGRSMGELDAHRQSVAKLLEGMKANIRVLGNSHQLEELQEELQQVVKQIDTIRDEEMLHGRMSIVSTGQEQLMPSQDPRPKYAAGAGVIGMCLPAGAMMLLSLTSRRYRYSDEAQSHIASPVPLLGILPELPGRVAESEEVLAAAHSVHQIRVSLEALGSTARSRAYLITSSTAGEGKTSLSMSLGLSFAAAGLQTLVIDCDLIGRHLTDSFRAKDMGGLQEALAAGSLKNFIRKTHGGLHLLTAGTGMTADACALPRAAIRALLKEARRYFHVILIDSGPILGSLEAAVLAREVDGVIFTITQGQHRRLVEHALRRLDSLGARVAGLIFNRAKRQDFHHSPFGSSARSKAAGDSLTGTREELQQLTKFGPLVHAVAGGLPVGAK